MFYLQIQVCKNKEIKQADKKIIKTIAEKYLGTNKLACISETKIYA